MLPQRVFSVFRNLPRNRLERTESKSLCECAGARAVDADCAEDPKRRPRRRSVQTLNFASGTSHVCLLKPFFAEVENHRMETAVEPAKKGIHMAVLGPDGVERQICTACVHSVQPIQERLCWSHDTADRFNVFMAPGSGCRPVIVIQHAAQTFTTADGAFVLDVI
jgi:hypothetical protein